ncbi:uncharacterized protein LOC143373707 [Andrena cerasifolii]|uniref:uncharacterized protein LOC143373707 n=1 Tax=Andrena cerasifolii TaxID=2819439 RepID=UPI00403848A0
MCRSILISAIVLTLAATTCSRSVELENDETSKSTASDRLATMSPDLPLIHDESESGPKKSAKRSLLILMPTDEKNKARKSEGAETLIRKSPKTKRCKTPLRRERFSVPVAKEKINQAILRLKNARNSYNEEKDTGYPVNQKNPDTAAKRDPMSRELERGEGAADGNYNVKIIKAIREKLKSRNQNVGAARKNVMPSPNVFEDDKYICYCREKSSAAPRKGTNQGINPRQPWLTRENKKVLPGKTKHQTSMYANVPRQRFLPAWYHDTHRHIPNHLVSTMNPILLQRGNERLPYIPYNGYPADPRFAIYQEMIPREIPPKNHIPFNPVAGSSDSIVGQRRPTDRGHDLTNNQQTIEQRTCLPNVTKKPSQSATRTNPAPSSKTSQNAPEVTDLQDNPTEINHDDAQGEQSREDSTGPDFNLQSMHSQLPEYSTMTSVSVDDESQSESLGTTSVEENLYSESPLQATGPETAHAESPVSSGEASDEYETTGSETLDYSEIKEVTSAYFASKAYTEGTEETNEYFGNDGPSSFDDLRGTKDEATNANPLGYQNDDSNLQSRLDSPKESSMQSGEMVTNMKVKNSNEDASEDQSPMDGAPDFDDASRDDGDLVGRNNPFWGTGNSEADNASQNLESSMEGNINDPNYNEPKVSSNVEETTAVTFEGLTPADEAGAPEIIDDKDTAMGEEFSSEDYSTESPEMEDNAGPLRRDYEGENFESDKPVQKIPGTDEEDGERSLDSDSLMDETIDSADSERDTGIDQDFINTDNEKVAATIRDENEENSLVESTLKSSSADEAAEIKDASGQTLPFCDNTLLQKAIKTVINNFATGDSPEMEGNEETVGSTGQDLLQEIVGVPNLKGIVSMPAIQHMIVDRVKDLLTKVTNVARHNFDSSWATNVIRNNLRNTMAAAPASNADLPPMTVAERQFKSGKWVTNLVTLQPTTNEETPVPNDLERLQGIVNTLIRDPAVGLQAAKHPAVQNMIVQSVRNTFKPENATSNDDFDEAVIQAALDKELSIMEMENMEITTTGGEVESEAMDMSNVDMKKLLDIAKSEAGMDDAKKGEENLKHSDVSEDSSTAAVLKSTGKSSDRELSDTSIVANTMQSECSSDEEAEQVTSPYQEGDGILEDSDERGITNPVESLAGKATSTKLLRDESFESTVSSATEPLSSDLVGATRNPELMKHLELASAGATACPIVEAEENGKLESEEVKVGKQESEFTTSKYKLIYTESLLGASAVTARNDNDDQENTDEIVEVESSTGSSTEYSGEDSPEKSFAYLGTITMKKKDNYTDDIQGLQSSELYYVGDGVKLPLEIRKLKDGSYALSISRKVCEHLLNKECPCCVPAKGNIVRTVRKDPETKDADRTIGTSGGKRISKRESAKLISPKERRKRDSADDSLQTFSMPVETFARRYNLSLNLEKVQAPWNFDAKEKIDERQKGGGKNSDIKEEGNADTDLRHDLLSIRAVSENGKSEAPTVQDGNANDHLCRHTDGTNDGHRKRRQRHRNFPKYRYERTIDETVNERVKIVKNVLNWLREMILDAATEE